MYYQHNKYKIMTYYVNILSWYYTFQISWFLKFLFKQMDVILMKDLTSGTTSGFKDHPDIKMAAILKISKYFR